MTPNTVSATTLTATTEAIVPTPVNPNDAATKNYVDSQQDLNLSSPPPIGNVTPNTGAFTVLNNVQNAAAAAGSDFCAKVNAAITAALAAHSSVVDASGFAGPQTCSSTIVASAPMTIKFPVATITFNVSPGINVTGSNVVLEGQGWSSVLKSGVAGILIQDTTRGAWGGIVRKLSLIGNSVGTVGLFMPDGQLEKFEDLDIEGFTGVALFDPAEAVAISGMIWIEHNPGEGVVFGSDSNINGFFNVGFSGGGGVHFIGGSVLWDGGEVYNNGLDGVYFDGRPALEWSANTSIVRGEFIKPAANNPANWLFYSLGVGATSASQPTWSNYYTAGKLITDGTLRWIAVIPGSDVSIPGVGQASFGDVVGAFIDDNGLSEPAGFVSDNIRLEGAASTSPSANRLRISATHIAQAEDASRQVATHGIHILNAYSVLVENVDWIGSDCYGGNADQGGIVAENSQYLIVSGFNSHCASQNPIRLVATTNSSISHVLTEFTSDSGQTAANSACVYIDATSYNTSLNDIDCTGSSTGRGIYNLSGGRTTITGYLNTSTATPADSLGTAAMTGGYGYNGQPLNILVGGQGMTLDSSGNANFSQNATVAGNLSARAIAGVEFFVSKFASIQAAINAAYNNGSVLGAVVDDRTTPYTGPGFILYDSVTLKLAPTTYTINATVTYNNGNNNVTAGIVAVSGGKLIGSSTSTNHGTIITAANGLNADLIATSSVGTGTRRRRNGGTGADSKICGSSATAPIRPPATASTLKTWARHHSCAPSRSAAAMPTTFCSPAPAPLRQTSPTSPPTAPAATVSTSTTWRVSRWFTD